MILYNNGCSYTATCTLSPEQKYSHLLAEKLRYNLLAAATPGSSNRKILRCSLRDIISLLNKNEEVFAVIQLTHLHRTEYAGQRTELNQWKYRIRDDIGVEWDQFESITPSTTDINETVKKWRSLGLALHNEEAELIRLVADLITFTSFLKQNNINYLIFSGPKVTADQSAVCNDPLYQYLKKDNNVLDLFEFNMLDLTGQQKHPDVVGMQLIADYFFSLLS